MSAVLILAIDTSTFTTSVAVTEGSAGPVRTLAACDDESRSHSNRLLELVDQVLIEAGSARGQDRLTLTALDGIAIGAGPGSFTGLRIGMATAKGLAFSAGKPLWAVSSLAALALAAEAAPSDPHQAIVIPLIDARRGEVYAGFYRLTEAGALALAPERVLAPEDLPAAIRAVTGEHPGAPPYLLGDGLAAYADELGPALAGLAQPVHGARTTPGAIEIARLAACGDLHDAGATGAPVYIRLSEAEIKYPQGHLGGTFSPTS
ncbi:tRNA (adenosine(37)-N6)-threonylcarbamoyltransferase complex dimerization subunit type 1 TsaB [Haliangium sp.]|uniref:tRNA (adenosine(37)-N6)-threonylcarbamoyltransferase complex dimerization subunit type 1 TsaB n=1 Tax=Haliangium sp. TaxID=2663208 RepID=UPI003D098321